ncbi:MAG: tRNA threonylcarbamoyladenosine dehydratase [Pseudomonadota bacterium]
MSDRFLRTEMLLGKKNLDKLKGASITVVGLGAVGSFATEALARMGIGSLNLIDFDIVNESNINRQLYALDSTVGKKKVKLAGKRVLDINPNCNVQAYDIFLDEANCYKVLSSCKSDLIVDAIDSLSSKIHLIKTCVENSFPLISSMGAARKTDPSLIRTGDLSETKNCRLAFYLRKKLRKYGIEKGVKCVYSLELTQEHFFEPPKDSYYVNDKYRKDNPKGSLPYITGIFGLMIANEVVKKIIEKY